MVVRLLTAASADATRPTDKIRTNRARCSPMRRFGWKPALPRHTMAPMITAVNDLPMAMAMPKPASPKPAGSIIIHARPG